jgi:hypothetical protein
VAVSEELANDLKKDEEMTGGGAQGTLKALKVRWYLYRLERSS